MYINSNETQIVSGNFYFDNLSLIGKTEIKTLNKINMKDVVFDSGNQSIIGKKTFNSDFNIKGNLQVSYVNGQNINEEYRKTLFSDENVTLNGSIIFNVSPDYIKGIIVKNINGVEVKEIKETLKLESVNVKMNIVEETTKNIESLLESSNKMITSKF